jgi:hypothetical protein
MYTYEFVYCQPTRNCTYAAEGRGHSTCHSTSNVLVRYNTNVPPVEVPHLGLYTCKAKKYYLLIMSNVGLLVNDTITTTDFIQLLL